MAMAVEALPAALLNLHEDDVEEPSSLLRLRIQAMTWAAHAKDASLNSLHSQLHSSLLLAQSAHHKLADALGRNLQLERQVEDGRTREQVLESRIVDLTRRLESVQVAEERLASEMGQLEAESLQRAIESSRLVSSLNEQLKEKERLLEESRRQVQDTRAPLGEDPKTDLASQIVKAQHNLQMLEKKVSEVESARRESEDELRQSENKCVTLQQRLEAAEAGNRKLEKVNKELLAKTRHNEEDKFVSLKLEDLGMRFRFWDPATLAGNKAAITA